MRKTPVATFAALTCRGCGANLGEPFLNLGRTPLANSYLRPGQNDLREETFPLATSYCGGCHLVQLTDSIPPEKLFTKYLYFSSYSESFLKHVEAMAQDYAQRFALGSRSRVLEIASNDGYLLQYFGRRKIPVLGIEPAGNIASEALRRGIPTLVRFFERAAVAEILEKFGAVDLVVGNNVLAHVSEINGFLEAVAAIMKSRGAAAFEFPYLGELLKNVEFDTIYHEHVFYYSLSALCNLAQRAKLEAFDAIFQPIHGGSLRVFLQHPGVRPVNSRVTRILAEECRTGLTSGQAYESFGSRVSEVKSKLLDLLISLKAAGKRLAAYGAPAKGNTLLNFCGIGRDLLEFTVDLSPHKQGLLLPGSRLPILKPALLVARRPEYTLILPWNIADEIILQQRAYRKTGGQFIVPIPEPHII
jgi:SAM-dependent methyltransferase